MVNRMRLIARSPEEWNQQPSAILNQSGDEGELKRLPICGTQEIRLVTMDGLHAQDSLDAKVPCRYDTGV